MQLAQYRESTQTQLASCHNYVFENDPASIKHQARCRESAYARAAVSMLTLPNRLAREQVGDSSSKSRNMWYKRTNSPGKRQRASHQCQSLTQHGKHRAIIHWCRFYLCSRCKRSVPVILSRASCPYPGTFLLVKVIVSNNVTPEMCSHENETNMTQRKFVGRRCYTELMDSVILQGQYLGLPWPARRQDFTSSWEPPVTMRVVAGCALDVTRLKSRWSEFSSLISSEITIRSSSSYSGSELANSTGYS
jgi:hypothetical protein